MSDLKAGNRHEELLSRLQEFSKAILELNFDKEEDLEVLAQYQQEQAIIMQQLQNLLSENGKALEAHTRLVKECYELEQRVQFLLTRHKEQAREQISKINISMKQRNSYQNPYSQSHGYFVDQHK